MADKFQRQLTNLRILVKLHKTTDHVQRTKINERLQERKQIAVRMKKTIEELEFKADTITYLRKINQ